LNVLFIAVAAEEVVVEEVVGAEAQGLAYLSMAGDDWEAVVVEVVVVAAVDLRLTCKYSTDLNFVFVT
jgi:hypothetical protein